MRYWIALALIGCGGSDESEPTPKTDSAIVDSAFAVDTTVLDTANDTAPYDGAAMGEPFCPPQRPMDASTCSGFPAARKCSYWPNADAATECQTCTCTDGKWTCAIDAMCSFTYMTCQPGTACMPNTGCGRGRCNYFCGCGSDGVLHCSANPC
jgi:hypothetical protein